MTIEDDGTTPDTGITHYFTPEQEARERMRVEFEGALSTWDLSRSGDGYVNPSVNQRWQSWQACAAHAQCSESERQHKMSLDDAHVVVAKLEESVEIFKSANDTLLAKVNNQLAKLAAAQADNVRLRQMARLIVGSGDGGNCGCKFCQQAREMLAYPLDTTALDAHVEEKTAALRAELASKTGALEIQEALGKAVVQQLASAQAVIKGKDEALQYAEGFIAETEHTSKCSEMCRQDKDWERCICGKTNVWGIVKNALALTPDLDVLDEYVREQMGMLWQPIDTAPKGKIVFVYYLNELGNGRTMRARYYLPETLESDFDASGCAPEGWYEESEAYEYLMPLEHEPTHWMPLPLPPTTKEGK